MSKELLIILAGWLILISVITAAVTVADKVKASKGAFRVSEKTLFALALLGGSLAEYITMRLIHHKTRHKRFMLGLPAIITLQLLTVFLFFIRFFPV